jgi:hypothetical protein
MAGNKYHPAVRQRLLLSQAIESRDTKEYFEHIAKRNILRQAVLKAMADNNLDALAYASVRRKASPIGEEQVDAVNRKLASNSGLPAIVVPAGFTPDGLPVGIELLGRAWSEPQLIKLAYSYEQATHHRRPPAAGQHTSARSLTRCDERITMNRHHRKRNTAALAPSRVSQERRPPVAVGASIHYRCEWLCPLRPAADVGQLVETT